MMKKALTAAVLGLSLTALPALAQNSTSANATNASKDQPHQTASQMNLWPATKIKGLNVYNQSNQKIGDISDLMLNKEGKIDTAVVSVGGFLGIGTHDVAVKFSELKWEMEPVKSTTTSSNAPASANRPAGTVGSASTSNTANSGPKRFWPDHAVMANATKDQLKAMPQFDASK